MKTTIIFAVLAALLLVGCWHHEPLTGVGLTLPLDASARSGVGSLNWSDATQTMNDGLFDTRFNSTTTFLINGTTRILWVPWMGTSSACGLTDLKSGTSCNNNSDAVNFTQNCMVSDESSQVSMQVGMGTNQTRMDYVYNMVLAIRGLYGQLPSWRIYRYFTSIYTSKSGINGNGDSASDATARYIISFYAGANSTFFTNQTGKTQYWNLANNLSRDHVTYEAKFQCLNSSLGYGNICWWLAGGAAVRNGGFASTDFWYSGYYGDAIIAMLLACSNTGNNTYCAIAGNYTLNYLQAAYPAGTLPPNRSNVNTLRFPPGRSGSWLNTGGGSAVPTANCTNTCGGTGTSNIQAYFESADAPRGVSVCQANYYARDILNITLPGLDEYCATWQARYMTSATTFTYQYYANATNSNGTQNFTPQSGYLAQGWEAQGLFGGTVSTLNATLTSCSGHFSSSTKTWDGVSCYGVYNEAFCTRAMQEAIGRLLTAFGSVNTSSGTTNTSSNITISNEGINTTSGTNGAVFLVNTTVITSYGTLQNVTAEFRFPNGTLFNMSMSPVSITTSGTNSTGYGLNDSDNFASTSENWTGGTLDPLNKLYNLTGTFGTMLKNFKTQDFSAFNFSTKLYVKNTSNIDVKLFVVDDGTANTNDYVLLDCVPGLSSCNLKHITDGGGYQSCDSGSFAFVQGASLDVIVNKTDTSFSTYYNGAFCHKATVTGFLTGAGNISISQGNTQLAIGNVTYSVYTNSTTSTTTNTSSYQVNFSQTAASGTYNITRLFANTTGADKNNKTTTLSFIIGSNNPIITLLSPTNASTQQRLAINFTFNSTNSVDTTSTCSLFTNKTGSWAIAQTVTANNATPTNLTTNFSIGTYLWNVQCNNSLGGSNFSNNNFTVTISPPYTNVALSSPANRTNSSLSTILFNYTITDLVDTSPTCSLYTNSTGTWKENTTTAGTVNVSNYFSVSFPVGSYKWNVQCNNSEGRSNFSNNNFTFNVISTPYPVGVLCPYITNMVFNTNTSRGTYASSTNQYTESNITPVNQSLCNYTYLLNNTNGIAINYTFYTNISAPGYLFVVNNVLFNLSQNATITVQSGIVNYSNISMNLTNVSLNTPGVNFSINVTSGAA